MRIHIARSVFEVMASLESAVQNDRSMRAAGQAWISEKFQSQLERSLHELRQASADHGLISQGLALAQRERREQVTRLTRLVRDFYVVLRRRAQREGKPQLELLYGRPARLPHSAPVTQWLEWAQHIVRGEQQAREQGYSAMVNPSAADIEAALAEASACQIQWSTHQNAIKIHEQRLRQASTQGTRTLRGLATRLRETLVHETGPVRREIMRTFGFSFISTGAKERQQAHSQDSILTQISLIPRPPTDPPANPPQEDSDPQVIAQSISESNLGETQALDIEQASMMSESAQLEPVPTEDAAPTLALVQAEPAPQSSEASRVLNPNHKTKKLSRREKKALRRAQQAA